MDIEDYFVSVATVGNVDSIKISIVCKDLASVHVVWRRFIVRSISLAVSI